MPHEITYYCSFCDEKETVSSPTSFATRHGGDIEDAACPDHASAMDFLNDQCPGCVSGWGECEMFMAIGNRTVSDENIASIQAGKCPYRTNGTLMFSSGKMERLDLSTKSESGEAFALAARPVS